MQDEGAEKLGQKDARREIAFSGQEFHIKCKTTSATSGALVQIPSVALIRPGTTREVQNLEGYVVLMFFTTSPAGFSCNCARHKTPKDEKDQPRVRKCSTRPSGSGLLHASSSTSKATLKGAHPRPSCTRLGRFSGRSGCQKRTHPRTGTVCGLRSAIVLTSLQSNGPQETS